MSENRCDCEKPTASEAADCCPPETKPEPCCLPREEPKTCSPPPAEPETSCCPGETPAERPGYRLWSFVAGWQETAAGRVPRVRTGLDRSDVLARWQMRWGLGRDRYRVAPGLYAVGRPDVESPVLVSANYKLSFDALRRELTGLDAWLLAIDTRGINVWCAAGKGTFGTDEIVRRVRASGLEKVVSHRTLVVPQLGAPGVAAHEVQKGCGFRVVYGPVRARDLPAFLDAGMQATEKMRRVTFTVWERTVLTPVELTLLGRKLLWIALALLLLGGIGGEIFSPGAAWSRGGAAILTGLGGLLAGAVVTPILLPWLPGRPFALKGAVAGGALAAIALFAFGGALGWLNGAALLLALTAVASYCAMNFTGSSTFTSPSGVEKEMRRALPLQIGALAVAAVCWLTAAF